MPLNAETVFFVGQFRITNSILDMLFVDIVLLVAVILLRKNLKFVPNLFQNIVEMFIKSFYDLTETIADKDRAKKIFPFFMSFFIFILIANWSELIPGFSSIGFFEEHENKKTLVPFFRSATSDLNTTLALALISAIATHALSIKVLGMKEYLGRFFSLNPINLFIGILEIISEITKVISLSFRLFGNIFAGGVLLSVISGIAAIIIPLPFLLLEIIVGLVQALIFATLTMVFMSVLTTPHNISKEVNH